MGRVVSEQPDEPYSFLMHLLERKAARLVSVCVRGWGCGVCVCVTPVQPAPVSQCERTLTIFLCFISGT